MFSSRLSTMAASTILGLNLLTLQAKVATIDFYQIKSPLHFKNQSTQNRVMCVTIPKCGTHLLMKCITELNISGLSYNYTKEAKTTSVQRIRKINKKPPPHHFKGVYYETLKGILPRILTSNLINRTPQKLFFTHCPYLAEFERFLQAKTISNFLMIRDPRAMVVSFAFMVHKSREGKTADLDKTILSLITGNQKDYIPWAVEQHEIYPLIWEIGLYNFYKMYLPWATSKKFMLIKFEDLIGEKGGGSTEKQLQTIMEIGQHLGVKMTEQKTQETVNKLFGGTWTFREGQIDSWKNYFTPKIKQAFKQSKPLLKLLIDLGYEQSINW